jgi:transcriptional regulator with XRE-family HTH domain
LNQRDFARKCDLSPAYVAALERGISEPPPLSTCKVLARALAVSWEEAWDRSFAARLTKWLKHQGFTGISETDLLEIVKKIKSASK